MTALFARSLFRYDVAGTMWRALGSFLLLLLMVAAAAAAESRYVVTLDVAAVVDGSGDVAAELAAAYGGELDASPAGDGAFVIRISDARARLLSADHRVAALTPLRAASSAAIPIEAVAWSSGVSYSYDGVGNVRQAGTEWRDQLTKSGMERMRRARMHPLSGAPVAFW